MRKSGKCYKCCDMGYFYHAQIIFWNNSHMLMCSVLRIRWHAPQYIMKDSAEKLWIIWNEMIDDTRTRCM